MPSSPITPASTQPGRVTRAGGKPYPAIPRLGRAARVEFTPFLAYDVEVRRVLFSTNAIESLNARYRRAVGARGRFPTEQPHSNACTWGVHHRSSPSRRDRSTYPAT